jgi:hypothetical protein
MHGILFLKNSIAAREPPAKSETGLKPAPPVIKTRIGECKAAHQSSDQWIGKLKYLSIPPSFIRMVNLCENFWRFEQSIVASSRYEREC